MAVLLDGGYVVKRLRFLSSGETPSAQSILRFARNCVLADETLFRIYYYDCPPYAGTSVHPITKETVDFAASDVFAMQAELQREIAVADDVAFRRGVLVQNGWRLATKRVKQLVDTGRAIEARDFEPDFTQKRVDMKIGLDVAWLATQHIVDGIILVAGDSDFVPAMRFARQQGLRVTLVPLGNQHLPDAMREESDEVREVEIDAPESGGDV